MVKSIVLDANDIGELVKVDLQMVVTFLDIKSEVGQTGILMVFQLLTQSFNLLNLRRKNFVQVILDLSIRDFHVLLLDLCLLEHFCVSHISDHDDQCFLPVDLHLLFFQNHCAVSIFRGCFDMEHS